MAKSTGLQSFGQDLYFWLQALTAALVTLILLFTFVGRIISVEGDSMLSTLHNADTMLLQSLGYAPKQGDVVVLTKYFAHVQGPIVKRVIATGGQTVDIDYAAGTVTVDGRVLDEPYIREPMYSRGPERISHLMVPEGQIFVMGDNRNNSDDSRNPLLGAVDGRYVLGKVLMVMLPFEHIQVMNGGNG